MRPLRFHPSVQKDINGAVNHYWAISEGLAEEFWGEVQGALAAIERAPEAHHFDPSGLRRSNLMWIFGVRLDARSEAVGEIDSIDPNAAVLDENDNYVYKPEVGDQLVAVPSDTTQGRQSVFTPIANLSVKPRKVIRLNFHPLDFHIHYRKGKELSHIHRSELKSIPEREKLESYLNRVYGPQCNVWFEVSVSKKEIVTLATETPSTSEPPGHATDDQLIAMKGCDLGGYKDEFTSEEDAILAKFKYNNARLNVYFIPETYEGAAFSVRIKDANGLWVGKARAYGYAQGDVKTDEGDEVKGTIFMTEATGTAFSQEHILAHEVGHIIGNLPHPEVAKESIRTPTLGQGPFCFLPGTDLRDRLMAGAEHYNRATGSPLLVKCEWDAIQAWIALNVDE